MSQDKILTTASGAPVADNQNSRSAGPRGPLLLDDFHLISTLPVPSSVRFDQYGMSWCPARRFFPAAHLFLTDFPAICRLLSNGPFRGLAYNPGEGDFLLSGQSFERLVNLLWKTDRRTD